MWKLTMYCHRRPLDGIPLCQRFCWVNPLDLAFGTVWRSRTQRPWQRWANNCTRDSQQSCWSDREINIIDVNKFWLTYVRLATSSHLGPRLWLVIYFCRDPSVMINGLWLAVILDPSWDHRQWCQQRGHLRTSRERESTWLVQQHLAQNKVPWEFCDESKPPC